MAITAQAITDDNGNALWEGIALHNIPGEPPPTIRDTAHWEAEWLLVEEHISLGRLLSCGDELTERLAAWALHKNKTLNLRADCQLYRTRAKRKLKIGKERFMYKTPQFHYRKY